MKPTSYASTKNKHITSIRQGLLRFSSRSEAESRLKIFRDVFIVSKIQDEDSESLRFWIKGFEVTKEEASEGLMGNFAKVTIEELHNGEGFTLNLQKTPVKRGHPMRNMAKIRRQRKHRHPNWEHPVMRDVKKKTTFPSEADAQARLQVLYEDYPEVIIPTRDQHFVMLYDRSREPPVHRCIITINEVDDGYLLEIRDNPHQSRAPRVKTDEVLDSRFILNSNVPAIKLT